MRQIRGTRCINNNNNNNNNNNSNSNNNNDNNNNNDAQHMHRRRLVAEPLNASCQRIGFEDGAGPCRQRSAV